jgi:hypothetical protein
MTSVGHLGTSIVLMRLHLTLAAAVQMRHALGSAQPDPSQADGGQPSM